MPILVALIFFLLNFIKCLDENFIKEALNTHNQLRAKHNVPKLQLNKELNELAQAYAEKLIKINRLEHSPRIWRGEIIGENLSYKMGGKLTGIEATNMWYNEIKFYNFNNPGFSQKTGHFTQVVWKGSNQVGFGIATRGNKSIVVANYYPPGNIIGNFKQNVLRPR